MFLFCRRKRGNKYQPSCNQFNTYHSFSSSTKRIHFHKKLYILLIKSIYSYYTLSVNITRSKGKLTYENRFIESR
jgi:hypothetical protein